MTKRILTWTVPAVALALILVIAWGCSGGDSAKSTAKAETSRPPVAVDVAVVAPAEVMDGVDVVGALAPKYQADVKSEYTGIVSEIYVTEWIRVAKGTPLAKLDTREGEVLCQKAQAAVEAAKANQLQARVAGERAEREYARALKMKEVGLVTQQQVDDAATARDAAAAQIRAAEAMQAAAEEDVRHAQTRLDKAVIRSPLDGVVAMRGVNVGDLAGEMGSPKLMFQIVDNRLLNLTVTVPSTEMEKLRLGQELVFTTDALPGRTFTGKVMFINPSVTEADRSVGVIAEVRNVPEVLKGGLFVKGRIITGERASVLRVPRIALVRWDVNAGTGSVFLANGRQAEHRDIRTGAVSGDWVEVAAGLQAGDRVITRGVFNLKDGDPLIVGPESGE
jgi:membrane fusion protein (multidrug efflux system)